MKLIDRVSAIVSQIPAGEVRTYTELAASLGFQAARHSKEVATAVAKLVTAQARPVPWWRVVANNGRLIAGSEAVQHAMLATEGVAFDAAGGVDLARRR